jgi:cytochrome c-type biogenesis protein
MIRDKLTSSTEGKPAKFLVPGLLFLGTILLILAVSLIDWTPIFQPVQDVVFIIEESYREWLVKQSTNNPLVLLPLLHWHS